MQITFNDGAAIIQLILREFKKYDVCFKVIAANVFITLLRTGFTICRYTEHNLVLIIVRKLLDKPGIG